MDSVSLRVHCPKNVHNEYIYHGDMIRALLLHSDTNHGIIRIEHDWFMNSVSVLANEMTLVPYDMILNEYHYVDSDKRMVKHKGRMAPPSSHYNIGYLLDIERESFDVSFSIPKLFYGNSIAQLVANPHSLNKNFVGMHGDFNAVTVNWYSMLIKAIKEFFNLVFTGVDINYKLVEIVRIDIAFNQYFESKDIAIKMGSLMASKSLTSIRGKRGMHEYSTEIHSTGFASIHKNIYYKVYHKGTEFTGRKGDCKRMISFNNRLIKRYKRDKKEFPNEDHSQILKKTYDVTSLTNEADLILRHEIRFDSTKISYWWKRHIFRSKCKTWQTKKDRFRILDKKRQNYRKTLDIKYRFTDAESKEHQDLKAILDKRHRFMIEVDNAVKLHSTENIPLHENYYTEVHFSKELFTFFLNKFRTIMMDCQISEFPEKFTLMEKIKAHNKTAKTFNDTLHSEGRKMPIISQKAVFSAYKLILEHGSLENALDALEVTQRTFFRYRKILKELGYSSAMSLTVVKTSTNFDIYFERLRGIGVEKNSYSYLFDKILPKHKLLF